MPSTRVIRRRIRSVQNTAKITKAMQMIAASKMRRAQLRVLAARPYATKMVEVLGGLAARYRPEGDAVFPLLQVRPVRKVGVVLVTPDRGLCGGLNANVSRRAVQFIVEQSAPASFVTVGKKGRDLVLRYGREIHAEFTFLGDYPSLLDTLPISRVVIDDYTSQAVDEVVLVYSQFVNTAVQRPVVRQLLPIQPPAGGPMGGIEFDYEPDPATVLGGLLPRYIEMQIYHAVLENSASEQSARMVAMRSATDNALEMVDGLTLQYNKARQETITKELLDIVGGVTALEKA